MDDEISQLIKEAKPLYFARKKRNNCLKAVAAMLVCVGGLSCFYPKGADYSYYAETGWYAAEGEYSVIEEMGLPTDDYGLLMIG